MTPTVLDKLPMEVLRKKQINSAATAEFLGISREELKRRLRLGLVPRPNKFNGHRNTWSLGTLMDHVEAKEAETKGAA